MIQHAETLKYDVAKAQLAKKRKHRAHEDIDASPDTVVESASVAPIASCQTTVQAVNTEHVKEAGHAKDAVQTKGQEQEKGMISACCMLSGDRRRRFERRGILKGFGKGDD